MFNKALSVIVAIVVFLFMLYTIYTFREIGVSLYVIVGLCIALVLAIIGLLVAAFR